MTSTTQQPRPDRITVSQPQGGYILLTPQSLLQLWNAYREGDIQLVDLRVALAGIGLIHAKRVAQPTRTANVAVEEVRHIAGGPDSRKARSSLNRLAKAQCTSELLIARRPADPACMLPNPCRLVPVPRRLIAYLSHCSRPAVVATAFALLIRGAFYSRGTCTYGGSVKAEWIADTFRLDLRTVKAARTQLIDIGFIAKVPTHQLRLNRYGQSFTINPQWTPPPSRCSPPLTSAFARRSPPPCDNKNLSQGRMNNQNPQPPGVCTPGAKPTLRHIEQVDLQQPERTELLYQQAVAQRLLSDSAASRLTFFAAAQHARRTASRNAPGMMATIIRRGLWHHASSQDEDAARVLLNPPRVQVQLKRPGTPKHTSTVGGGGDRVTSDVSTLGPTPSASAGFSSVRQVLAGLLAPALS
jgi:hypothetical protein